MLCMCGVFWVTMLVFLYLYALDFTHSARSPRDALKLSLDMSSDGKFPKHFVAEVNVMEMGVKNGEEGNSIVVKMASPSMVRNHQRLAEYCNIPNTEKHGDEAAVSNEYTLRSVHIFTRHGDRNMLTKFKRDKSAAEIPCVMDSEHMHSHQKLTQFKKVMTAYSYKPHPESRFKNWALYPDQSMCRPGDLTSTGALQHIVLGNHLAKKYIDRLFLGHVNPEMDISVKSTETIRTYQSAVSFMYGFLPEFNLTKLNIVKARKNMCIQESPEMPCYCPSTFKYMNFAEQFEVNHNRLDKNYKRVMRQVADIYQMPYTEVPLVAWALLDPFMVRACHNLPQQCNTAGRCIDGRLLEKIWELNDNREWAINNVNKNLQKASSLEFYPLFREIAQQMKSTGVNSVSVPRFNLYSAHDTTLTGVLTALRAYSGRWSSYASNLIFEHYYNRPRKTHHIRILLDGRDITRKTSFCADTPLKEICDLQNFVDFVHDDMLSELFGDLSYKDICGSTS